MNPTNPDPRPLPAGWNAHFDPGRQAWIYVQNNGLGPLRMTMKHPLGPLPPPMEEEEYDCPPSFAEAEGSGGLLNDSNPPPTFNATGTEQRPAQEHRWGTDADSSPPPAFEDGLDQSSILMPPSPPPPPRFEDGPRPAAEQSPVCTGQNTIPEGWLSNFDLSSPPSFESEYRPSSPSEPSTSGHGSIPADWASNFDLSSLPNHVVETTATSDSNVGTIPVNPDTRPLPDGWSAHYNPAKKAWVYVQSNVYPAKFSDVHPLGPIPSPQQRLEELRNPDSRPLPEGWTEHYDLQKKIWVYVRSDICPPFISQMHPLGPVQSAVASSPTSPVSPSASGGSGLSLAQQLYASVPSAYTTFSSITTPSSSPSGLPTPAPSPSVAPHRQSTILQEPTASPNSLYRPGISGPNASARPNGARLPSSSSANPHRLSSYTAPAPSGHDNPHRTSTFPAGASSPYHKPYEAPAKPKQTRILSTIAQPPPGHPAANPLGVVSPKPSYVVAPPVSSPLLLQQHVASPPPPPPPPKIYSQFGQGQNTMASSPPPPPPLPPSSETLNQPMMTAGSPPMFNRPPSNLSVSQSPSSYQHQNPISAVSPSNQRPPVSPPALHASVNSVQYGSPYQGAGASSPSFHAQNPASLQTTPNVSQFANIPPPPPLPPSSQNPARPQSMYTPAQTRPPIRPQSMSQTATTQGIYSSAGAAIMDFSRRQTERLKNSASLSRLLGVSAELMGSIIRALQGPFDLEGAITGQDYQGIIQALQSQQTPGNGVDYQGIIAQLQKVQMQQQAQMQQILNAQMQQQQQMEQQLQGVQQQAAQQATLQQQAAQQVTLQQHATQQAVLQQQAAQQAVLQQQAAQQQAAQQAALEQHMAQQAAVQQQQQAVQQEQLLQQAYQVQQQNQAALDAFQQQQQQAHQNAIYQQAQQQLQQQANQNALNALQQQSSFQAAQPSPSQQSSFQPNPAAQEQPSTAQQLGNLLGTALQFGIGVANGLGDHDQRQQLTQEPQPPPTDGGLSNFMLNLNITDNSVYQDPAVFLNLDVTENTMMYTDATADWAAGMDSFIQQC